MKRKSPISIDRIQFCAYKCYETEDLVFIDQFLYEDRHDFLVNKFLGGIAIKLEISNKRYDKGARRNVSLSLVDMTARYDVATQQIKVCLAIDGFKDCYAYFPAETSSLVGGHTYKLLVCDETASETLTERIFHLFDKSTMKNPAEWYEICDGGIRPAWKTDLFKSLNTVDSHDYYVQFNLAPNMGRKLPTIMPELEIRLHYPDGQTVKTFFKEPFCRSLENYDDNRWTIECPFETSSDINGVFYAELLCMGYPIAGFVFDTMCPTDISGKWYGHEIQPIDEYSLKAELFDEFIERYIASEYKALSEERLSNLYDNES